MADGVERGTDPGEQRTFRVGARSPLPGWFLGSPEAGEQILLDGVRAVQTGLR